MEVSISLFRSRLARTKDIDKRIDIQSSLCRALFDHSIDAAATEAATMFDTYTSLGNRRGVAYAELMLARIECTQGGAATAVDRFKRCVDYAEEADEHVFLLAALHGLSVA